MIKIYLDWNVMNGMKNGHLNSFKDIIINKNKFLLIYSTSHVGDIFTSVKNHSAEEHEMIREDLDYIKILTENLCIFNSKNQIVIDYYDPGELLDQRIEEAPMFKNLSIDSFFPSFEDQPLLNNLADKYKDLIASIPLDPSIKKSYDNPESAKLMDNMFPGLKDDFTMSGLFKCFGQMLQKLNEEEGYKELRKAAQKVGVNSSHFNENKNPYDVIKDAYKKIGVENFNIDELVNSSNVAPKWFNEITNEYIILDMHGYKSDKVKVNTKEKKTFKNTTEDAFHTAFASKCEFYITNDERNLNKARAVYEKLEINTTVLNTNEFVAYYDNFLDYHTVSEHFRSIMNRLESKAGFQEQFYTDGRQFGYVCYPFEYFFNFFNKLLLPKADESESFFILSKDYPSSNYAICYKEIEGVVKMFVDELGSDENNLSNLKNDEFKNDDDWNGRTWNTNVGVIKIVRVNTWFHLHFNPHPSVD